MAIFVVFAFISEAIHTGQSKAVLNPQLSATLTIAANKAHSSYTLYWSDGSTLQVPSYILPSL